MKPRACSSRRLVCVHLDEHRLLYLFDDVRLVVSEIEALIMFFGCIGALFSAVPSLGPLNRVVRH